MKYRKIATPKCLVSEHSTLYDQRTGNYPIMDTVNILKTFHGYDFALGMQVGMILRMDHVVVNVSSINNIMVAMVAKNKLVPVTGKLDKLVKKSDIKYLVDNNVLDRLYYSLPEDVRYGLRRKRF